MHVGRAAAIGGGTVGMAAGGYLVQQESNRHPEYKQPSIHTIGGPVLLASLITTGIAVNSFGGFSAATVAGLGGGILGAELSQHGNNPLTPVVNSLA